MARGAVELAIELWRMPALARVMRRQPLPPNVLPLIRIAAGCADTCREFAAKTAVEPAILRPAAALYLQQVVLSAGVDSYRTLGATEAASQAELAEHMRWLLKWLHPDRNRSSWETIFAGRVISAWQDVGTPERRARYDVGRARRAGERRAGGAGRAPGRRRGTARAVPYLPWIAQPVGAAPPRRNAWRRPFAVAFFACVATAALFVAPSWEDGYLKLRLRPDPLWPISSVWSQE